MNRTFLICVSGWCLLICLLGCTRKPTPSTAQTDLDLHDYAIVQGVSAQTKEKRLIDDKDVPELNTLFQTRRVAQLTRGFYPDLEWRIDLQNGRTPDTALFLCSPHFIMEGDEVYSVPRNVYVTMCRIASGAADVELDSENN